MSHEALHLLESEVMARGLCVALKDFAPSRAVIIRKVSVDNHAHLTSNDRCTLCGFFMDYAWVVHRVAVGDSQIIDGPWVIF